METYAADEAAALDRIRATRLLVRLADLPTGWVAEPHAASAEDDRVDRELRDCLEAGPRPARTADVSSEDFRLGQARVTSRVTTSKTVEEARREFALATSAHFRPCLVQVYKRSFARGAGQQVDAVDAKVEALAVEALADGSLGNRLVITVPNANSRDTFVADAYFVLSGRAQVSVNFVSLTAPVDPQLERAVLARVAERARS